MGDLTSKTLSLRTLDGLQFSPFAQVQQRDIKTALELIWVAFREQNPSRDDEAVFRRRENVLLAVLSAEWQSTDSEQHRAVWEEWRRFVKRILKRQERDPHILDILDSHFADKHLLETSKVYFESWVTARSLFKLLAGFKLKSVFCWASTTQEWSWYVWEDVSRSDRREVVGELWSIVNGLAKEKDAQEKGKLGYLFGDLTGHEERFTDPLYTRFPAFDSLLRTYREFEEEAGNTPYVVRFDGGKHLLNQFDPKREWRLDRQERERKEGSSSRHRTRSSSPRRTPFPAAANRLLEHTAHYTVDGHRDQYGRLIGHDPDEELSAALNGVHLGSPSTTVRSYQHKDRQNPRRDHDQELSAAFERVNLKQYHNLSHASPYSRRQRNIYRM